MESAINIFVPYQIDAAKLFGFINGKIILIWYWIFFYRLIMILEDENNIYIIFFYTSWRIFYKKF